MPENGLLDKDGECFSVRTVEAPQEEESTSMVVMTANFVTAGLGVGILSLPWSAAGASVVPAAMVNAVVMLLLAETCCIVAESCEKHQEFDLGRVLRRVPGRIGPVTEGLCNLIIWLTTFLTLVGYMIVAADAVLPMLSGSVLSSRTLLIVFATACCLPLCYLDQRYLSFSSFVAIAVNVYLFFLVAYQSVAEPHEGETCCKFGLGKGVVSLYSMIMMAICLQMNVPPMYKTLERRSVARFRKVVYVSYFFLFLLFTAFQTVALLAFGPNVPQDILSSLPQNAFGNAARFGMLGVILGVYPLMVIPMVAPIQDATWGGKVAANITTVGIALSSMVAAFFVTELGVLNVVNGAMAVIVIVTLAPGLLGLYVVERNRIAMFSLITMGVVTSVLGFLLPENYVDAVQQACYWK